jgi:hypothetical protein
MDAVVNASSIRSMSFLLERLNWPVRGVRWLAAREYAGLLEENEWSKLAAEKLLHWLSTRRLETEVTSGLAVLLCTKAAALPKFADVANAIEHPSILADMMLEAIYGLGQRKRGWLSSHSGDVPSDFEPAPYFKKYWKAHVPAILAMEFQRFDRDLALPFTRRWAYEWQHLMTITGAAHVGFPYHFVDASEHRAGVSGQFSQRQCDVYRSAYLRTLAFAVDQWRMPIDEAERLAGYSLPLNKGLLGILPIGRPAWLTGSPGLFSTDVSQLENAVEALIRAEPVGPLRTISLKLPVDQKIAEFGELHVQAVLASPDFALAADNKANLSPHVQWELPDNNSFAGEYAYAAPGDHVIPGATGYCIPTCLSTWPAPAGFWQQDYLAAGLSLAAPYLADFILKITTSLEGVAMVDEAGNVASNWAVWNDHWAPIHAHDGHTRCGTLTNCDRRLLQNTESASGLKLGWLVELNLWTRKQTYDDLQRTKTRLFFLD